jgi:hypothetical protein
MRTKKKQKQKHKQTIRYSTYVEQNKCIDIYISNQNFSFNNRIFLKNKATIRIDKTGH